MHSRRSVLRAGSALALAGIAIGGTSNAVAGVAHDRTDRWDGLRRKLQGDVVIPADPNYALAKQGQFAEFDAINPRAIAFCETPQDVRHSVLFARERGIGVRTRSGGHNYRGWSTGEGLVIDLSRINHAVVGPSTVRVGPGLQGIDGLAALAPHNRQLVAGTCPTVCYGGFLSGGGIGYQTRKFGLGSDRMTSAVVVLADGRIVRASPTREPDLFWALRGGGGGNFGVVVDFEVRPIEAPRMVLFTTTWSWDRIRSVFAAWQAWCVNGSNNQGSAFIVMLEDAAPGAVPLVIITGGYHGPEEELDTELLELVGLAGTQPTSRSATDLPFHDAMKAAYGCGELTTEQCHREGQNPMGALHRTGFLREGYRLFDRPFSDTELDRLVSAWDADRRSGQRRFLHCMSLGGASSEMDPTATAFVHRDARFIVGFTTQLDDPTPADEDAAAALAVVDRGTAVLDPISVGAYVNFPGTNLPNWSSAYYGENYPRLVRVKRHYDPDNFFRHPRSVGAPS